MSSIRNSPAHYGDVKRVMDLALKKPGLKCRFSTPGKAINFKQRCNRYRKLMREIAAEQVELVPGNRAEVAYDVLCISTIREDGTPDKKAGTLVLFSHYTEPDEIIDPDTGEPLDPFNTLEEPR